MRKKDLQGFVCALRIGIWIWFIQDSDLDLFFFMDPDPDPGGDPKRLDLTGSKSATLVYTWNGSMSKLIGKALIPLEVQILARVSSDYLN